MDKIKLIKTQSVFSGRRKFKKLNEIIVVEIPIRLQQFLLDIELELLDFLFRILSCYDL
jgi:hypothetical protein